MFEMNMVLLLAVSTWHVVGGINSFESQLFYNDDVNIEYAIEEIFKNEVRFSLELYKATAAIETGSLALATAGDYIGLSMLNYGSNGLTKQQLSDVLNYSPNSMVARHGLRRLVTTLVNVCPERIRINSAIFHSYEKLSGDAFTLNLFDVFDSTLRYAANWNDLTNGNEIYNWGQQSGIRQPRIQTFEGEKSLVLSTAASLSAEIDLNGFGACYIDLPFYASDGTVTQRFRYVQIIAKLNYGTLSYRRDSNGVDGTAQFIKLAWVDPNIETILILTDELDGIMEFEKNLNVATMQKIFSNTVQRMVVAHLPILKDVTTAKNLKRPFENMQLNRMFNLTNDFENGIKNATMVGAALHECDINHTFLYDFPRCNKNVIAATNNLNDGGQKIFNANHPLIMLIVSKKKYPLILAMQRFDWSSTGEVGPRETPV